MSSNREFYEGDCLISIMMPTKDRLHAINTHMQDVNANAPQFMKAFQTLMGETKKDGELSRKIKELIGIALSVYSQCERCIVWHVKYAVDAGATKAEIIETCEVAVIMGGGPALMHMEIVLAALRDLGL